MSEIENKTALITGATGFVGPYLTRALLKKGYSCRCLVRDIEKARSLLRHEVELVKGDITRPETLEDICKGIDRVFHMATLGHLSNFVSGIETFRSVNTQGTINVMEAALKAGVDRFLHVSTVAAMGISSDVPATEDTPFNPHTPYGISKMEAEEKVLQYGKEKGLPAVIIRYSMVYGPRDYRDMLKLCKLAKKGLFPKIGSSAKLTPLVHVDDAVEGAILAIEKGKIGEVYLITGDSSVEFDWIRKTILVALGVRRPPLYIPEWPALFAASIIEKLFLFVGRSPFVSRKNIESTLADRVFSIEKAKRDLGYAPRISPDKGIKQTVKWYKEQKWV